MHKHPLIIGIGIVALAGLIVGISNVSAGKVFTVDVYDLGVCAKEEGTLANITGEDITLRLYAGQDTSTLLATLTANSSSGCNTFGDLADGWHTVTVSAPQYIEGTAQIIVDHTYTRNEPLRWWSKGKKTTYLDHLNVFLSPSQ